MKPYEGTIEERIAQAMVDDSNEIQIDKPGPITAEDRQEAWENR